jgi:plasmid stabilization system protein ParE
MGFQVILSRLAEADLDDVIAFISTDNPAAAIRVGEAVVAHLRVLEKFPRFGRVVPEFDRDNLREIIHGAYRVIYQINETDRRIEVARIWHAARGTPELPSL